MDRSSSLELLFEYTQSESLRKHALAVETAMRAYAVKHHQDPELWGMVGLLHDFDYERYPNIPDHPLEGSKILQARGYSEEVRTAILGHASFSGVPRETQLAHTLFACDELCGFLVACALVQPNKKISEVKASSVKKKLKDKAFARSVSREDILNGTSEIDVPLEEHIQFVLDALTANAEKLGL